VAHPQFWVIGVSLLAWITLLGKPLGADAQVYCSLRSAERATILPTPDLLYWCTMVMAMMVPLMLGQLRVVALSSAWRRRHLAIGWYLGGYLAAWLLAWLALKLGSALWMPPPAPAASIAAGMFALACVWHFIPAKRRAATRCHRRTPLPIAGWRADLACLRYGMRNGVDCLVNCWPLMLAMIVLPCSPALMGVVMGFIVADRLPRSSGQRLLPPLLCASVAVGCVLGSLLDP
jgi:predicted metal-binding membrane protein